MRNDQVIGLVGGGPPRGNFVRDSHRGPQIHAVGHDVGRSRFRPVFKGRAQHRPIFFDQEIDKPGLHYQRRRVGSGDGEKPETSMRWPVDGGWEKAR